VAEITGYLAPAGFIAELRQEPDAAALATYGRLVLATGPAIAPAWVASCGMRRHRHHRGLGAGPIAQCGGDGRNPAACLGKVAHSRVGKAQRPSLWDSYSRSGGFLSKTYVRDGT